MKLLLTAGPTHEPIDAVRYIANRSSGRLGVAVAHAALEAGHTVTAILGPIHLPLDPRAVRIDVQTAAQMHHAVLANLPAHDVLIMAAAVADFRPVQSTAAKLPRGSGLTLVCEPTEDILADAASRKRSDQRMIGFSLEASGDLPRSREKLRSKHLDMIVYNPLETMNSATIQPTLLFADGRQVALPQLTKGLFAIELVRHAAELLRGQNS